MPSPSVLSPLTQETPHCHKNQEIQIVSPKDTGNCQSLELFVSSNPAYVLSVIPIPWRGAPDPAARLAQNPVLQKPKRAFSRWSNSGLTGFLEMLSHPTPETEADLEFIMPSY